MKKLLISLAVMLPLPASAQPYSESMADCASFYQNAAQFVRTDEKAEQIMANVRKWHAAAVSQARAEGQSLSEDAMWDKIDTKTDAWEAKGLRFAFSQEFRDWASYCRKFAKHTGVDLTF